jgi:hypothetical protein
MYNIQVIRLDPLFFFISSQRPLAPPHYIQCPINIYEDHDLELARPTASTLVFTPPQYTALVKSEHDARIIVDQFFAHFFETSFSGIKMTPGYYFVVRKAFIVAVARLPPIPTRPPVVVQRQHRQLLPPPPPPLPQRRLTMPSPQQQQQQAEMDVLPLTHQNISSISGSNQQRIKKLFTKVLKKVLPRQKTSEQVIRKFLRQRYADNVDDLRNKSDQQILRRFIIPYLYENYPQLSDIL